MSCANVHTSLTAAGDDNDDSDYVYRGMIINNNVDSPVIGVKSS